MRKKKNKDECFKRSADQRNKMLVFDYRFNDQRLTEVNFGDSVHNYRSTEVTFTMETTTI